MLGTGVQARAHARALVRVRPVEEVLLAGRDPERTAAVAAELASELGLPVRPATHEQAVRSADVVAPAPARSRSWCGASGWRRGPT